MRIHTVLILNFKFKNNNAKLIIMLRMIQQIFNLNELLQSWIIINQFIQCFFFNSFFTLLGDILSFLTGWDWVLCFLKPFSSLFLSSFLISDSYPSFDKMELLFLKLVELLELLLSLLFSCSSFLIGFAWGEFSTLPIGLAVSRILGTLPIFFSALLLFSFLDDLSFFF